MYLQVKSILKNICYPNMTLKWFITNNEVGGKTQPFQARLFLLLKKKILVFFFFLNLDHFDVIMLKIILKK